MDPKHVTCVLMSVKTVKMRVSQQEADHMVLTHLSCPFRTEPPNCSWVLPLLITSSLTVASCLLVCCAVFTFPRTSHDVSVQAAQRPLLVEATRCTGSHDDVTFRISSRTINN